MNARTRTFGLVTLSGLALSAAVVSTALAMEWRTAEPDDLKGDFKQPLKDAANTRNANSVTMMSESNGKDTFKVTIKGDDISAEVNGEKVPAERIRRSDGKVEILDANGGVLKAFNYSNGGNIITLQGLDLEHVGNLHNVEQLHRKLADQLLNGDLRNLDGRVWVGDGQANGRGDGQRREMRIKRDGKGGFKVEKDGEQPAGLAPGQNMGGLAGANANPPPVMIGITMSEPEDSVLEFLNIENAIRVDRVVEGLPGAAAGLQTGDLIIQVKGEKGIGQERLREILRESKPGDELQLKVARKGNQVQDVTVKLTAFDQSKLAATSVPGMNLQDDVAVVRPPQTRKWDEAQRQLEAAMKALKENPNLQPEALKKQIDEALSKASDALKSAQNQMRDGMNEMRFRIGNGGGDDNVTILRGREGDDMPQLRDMLITPRTPGSPRVEVRGMRLDNDQRLEALEKKLDDLNKRMDEIRDLLKESKGR